jgi:NAD(P)-dependent dehydrogenase (short-subunit alcohol dehydrogenase family)
VTATFRLDGRHALITGAGRGIGAATALAFASAGAATLTLLARTRSALEEVAALARGLGADARVVPCDVTDERALQEAFDAVEALDVLVYAAGTNVPQALGELDLATADRLWAVNVRAGLHATREAVARMPAGGAIVFVSSQMGHVGAARRSVYCATKHAVEGLVRALAVELAPRGVRVVSVAPTFVADPEFRDDVMRRIPLGRLATVDQVAAAVVYAASPAAASTTGCSLRVDGGWTAQ